mmetsp:Transcript_6170/g.15793  ORF Transcript_6170/g.15793 Transcript_6170/m.15793 type:complete len:294 (-) Transcript_6170:281-1162(-)
MHGAVTSLVATLGVLSAPPSSFTTAKNALVRTLREEYTSMFDPMRTEFYVPSVTFKDPMISISGISAYRNNVDMLAGRTLLGRVLFKDASIELHDVIEDDHDPYALTTRWTLQLCMQVLPWQPYARFSGVSKYTLNDCAQVVSQRDYWDSINLSAGEYVERPALEALADFCAQLTTSAGPCQLPGYELLRRASTYCVRRYTSSPSMVLTPMEGADSVPSAPVAVADVADASEVLGARQAAEALRRAATRDGLQLKGGYYVCEGTRNEVWIELEPKSADAMWPPSPSDSKQLAG